MYQHHCSTGRPKPRAQTLAALVCSLAVAATGCHRESTSNIADVRSIVRVIQPTKREVTDYAFFTGRFEAVESVDIEARVTGYLTGIDFVSGAEVKKDQRLFQVDPRPYQAALDEALGQVALSEAHLKLSIANYKRAVEVSKTPGAISQQDLDRYAAEQAESEAAVAAAKAKAESARLNVEFTNVLSPIDGIASRNLLTLGNMVHQDQTLLTTVVSQDPIYVYFDIDETTLLAVQRLIRSGKLPNVEDGGKVPVQVGLADEGNQYPHDGTVDFVDNQVDASTGTLQLRGVFANPPVNETERGGRLFIAGEFIRIRLPIGTPYEATLVPQAAINSDQGDKYLLLVNKDNVVEYLRVRLGQEQPDGLQVVYPISAATVTQPAASTPGQTATAPATATGENIVRTLTPDDRVVLIGLQRVRPGMTVDPRPAEQVADDGDN